LAHWIFHFSFQKVENFIVLGNTFRDKLARMGCSDASRFWVERTVADTSYVDDFSILARFHIRDSLRILFLSRIVASKGADVAVEAVRLATARLPDCDIELVMAGDGPELAKLKSRVARQSISNIHFVGSVTGVEKKNVLFDADVFLFPTVSEGMPNVILEAMLYGLPILSRPVGAIPEVVEHMTNGFLTDEGDASVFAEWIVTLATNPRLRHQMAKANHEKALKLYSSDTVRNRILRILDEVLEA
jgi:glycosyltransferase involved in cell wall biosynthesis